MSTFAGTFQRPTLCKLCAIALGGVPSILPVHCNGCGALCSAVRLHGAQSADVASAQGEAITKAVAQLKKLQDMKAMKNVINFNAVPPAAEISWRKPYVYGYSNKSNASSSEAPPPPPVQVPSPLPRVPPPKHIVLPLVTSNVAPPAITYQTLELLLTDLNRLLCTPHAGREFDFRGTCAVVALVDSDPASQLEARVTHVAWEILQRTVLAFDVNNLTIHTGARAAFTNTPSAAIWMGAPLSSDSDSANSTNSTSPCPCTRCEHNLTIGVATAERLRHGGQSIVVSLRHLAT